MFKCSTMDVLSGVRMAYSTAIKEGFPGVAERELEIEKYLTEVADKSGTLILTTKEELMAWIGENI